MIYVVTSFCFICARCGKVTEINLNEFINHLNQTV